jgi:anti-sigma B factor antagonist
MAIFDRWRNRNGNPDRLEAAGIRIEVVRLESGPTFRVSGRVTIDSSPHMRIALLRLLRNESRGPVTVDTSEVSYMDTSGVATLLEALTVARKRSLKLHLVGVSGQTRMLAEVTELPQIFEAAGSEVVLS